MQQSPLRLIKRVAEFLPKERVSDVPRQLRGIYVLYSKRDVLGADKYDVKYVGMAAAGSRRGIRGRLDAHLRSKRKRDVWTHFSAFEVWDNIRDEEIIELEGLFRHIYRKDSAASNLNIQRGLTKVKAVRQNDFEQWRDPAARTRNGSLGRRNRG